MLTFGFKNQQLIDIVTSNLSGGSCIKMPRYVFRVRFSEVDANDSVAHIGFFRKNKLCIEHITRRGELKVSSDDTAFFIDNRDGVITNKIGVDAAGSYQITIRESPLMLTVLVEINEGIIAITNQRIGYPQQEEKAAGGST